MGKRFDDLGMPFPLFEAPTEAACTDGPGACGHCGASCEVRFEGACYGCFRAGKVDHVIDTELGMVRREDVDRGMTHGIPLNSAADLREYEVVPHPVDPNFPDDKWFSVKVDSDELRELTRTPRYHSWQGERWLFCCKKACVFLGKLSRPQIEKLANEKGTSVAVAIAEVFGVSPQDGKELLQGIASESVSTHSFRCRECGRIRAVWDMD